jgi:hypothetical protein
MIVIEHLEANILKITLPKKLKEGDFGKITAKVENLIKKYHGKIKILTNASQFEGWESMEAFKQHLRFVRKHHKKVECIALIAWRHPWQPFVAYIVRLFLHPTIKVFGKRHQKEAIKWLKS